MHNKNIKNVIGLWLAVFLWCAFIYFLSSIPSLKSDFSSEIDFVLRKIAHMSEYGILTFLFFRAYSGSKNNLSKRKSISLAIMFAFTYALTDEYHQLFVSGREGSLRDVFVDSLGIFFVAFLIYKKAKK
ncbi:MAG: VanZ family protein [Candidatus Pacebacteria bacterium]|nr:VanZ family protein [Candidatus Paceibacterota bacterium]